MRIYDITVPLGPNTHIWDSGKAPSIRADLSISEGDFANVTSLAMGSHSGTHTDAPSHFVAEGATIDRLPAETLVGPALVVEHTGTQHITAADLAALGVDGSHQRVLFKTSNGPLWESPAFRRDFIALAPSAAKRLIELGVRLVGIDYLSIEPYEAGETCPIHRALMTAGIVVLEGADLREVPPGEYLLVCAPIKLVGAEGAPTRAFLIVEE
jgi:arylformamidase